MASERRMLFRYQRETHIVSFILGDDVRYGSFVGIRIESGRWLNELVRHAVNPQGILLPLRVTRHSFTGVFSPAYLQLDDSSSGGPGGLWKYRQSALLIRPDRGNLFDSKPCYAELRWRGVLFEQHHQRDPVIITKLAPNPFQGYSR